MPGDAARARWGPERRPTPPAWTLWRHFSLWAWIRSSSQYEDTARPEARKREGERIWKQAWTSCRKHRVSLKCFRFLLVPCRHREGWGRFHTGSTGDTETPPAHRSSHRQRHLFQTTIDKALGPYTSNNTVRTKLKHCFVSNKTKGLPSLPYCSDNQIFDSSYCLFMQCLYVNYQIFKD